MLSILVGMLGMLTVAGLLYFQPWQNQQAQNGTSSPGGTTSEGSNSQRRLEEENRQLQAEIERQREGASRSSSSSSFLYRSTCGSPAGSGSVWYGVVGDRRALSKVKNYCGDALIVGSNTQAASFTSRSEAEQFAKALTEATGYNFWVK